MRKEGPEGNVSYGYNEKNQLICQEGVEGWTTFTYNRQGSIIKAESPAGISEYIYNSKNQQIKVKCRNGQVQENNYDAEGLRHEIRENEKLLKFVYHRGQLLYEKGAEEKSNHLGCGIDALSSEGSDFYYHRDEQLSTALISSKDGDVQNHYQYDAFGNLLKAGEKTSNRFCYTGQQYDTVTGQYYLRARYYSLHIGRFTQEDPYLGDGLNLYTYCNNNPVIYYDPSGYANIVPGSRRDPNANPNIDYGTINEFGQRSGIIVEITPGMIGTGSAANQGYKPPGFVDGKSPYQGGSVHARGHLYGNQLGGQAMLKQI